jgi:hypothetical protein
MKRAEVSARYANDGGPQASSVFGILIPAAEIHKARSCPAYMQILNPTITGCLMPVTGTKSIGKRAAIPPASPRSSSMADRVPAAPQAGGSTLTRHLSDRPVRSARVRTKHAAC